MKSPTISGTIILLFIGSALADSPAIPMPKVTASQDGTTYFTMIPNREKYNDGFGVAYRLGNDGVSSELWRVDGWYAFEVHISNNGEFLVRMGNWAIGSEPSKKDLAVAFYKNGVELRSYSTNDLIENKKSVRRTVSHYMWQANDSDFPNLNYDNNFYLKTIEDKLYQFDVSTGEIVNEL